LKTKDKKGKKWAKWSENEVGWLEEERRLAGVNLLKV
jgi:hypothetical protein